MMRRFRILWTAFLAAILAFAVSHLLLDHGYLYLDTRIDSKSTNSVGGIELDTETSSESWRGTGPLFEVEGVLRQLIGFTEDQLIEIKYGSSVCGPLGPVTCGSLKETAVKAMAADVLQKKRLLTEQNYTERSVRAAEKNARASSTSSIMASFNFAVAIASLVISLYNLFSTTNRDGEIRVETPDGW